MKEWSIPTGCRLQTTLDEFEGNYLCKQKLLGVAAANSSESGSLPQGSIPIVYINL